MTLTGNPLGILSTPQAKKAQLSDPDYTRLLADMFNARLRSAAS